MEKSKIPHYADYKKPVVIYGRKKIAGIPHVQVRCTLCNNLVWTQQGKGNDLKKYLVRYTCNDCAPGSIGFRRSSTGINFTYGQAEQT